MPTDPIYDPPGFWRSEARKALATGGTLEDVDPILCLTGPPDVFLDGISSDSRTAIVRSRPPFEANYWRTRMWHCLSLNLRYKPGNSMEAKLIPIGTTTRAAKCPTCQTDVLYKTKDYIARAVNPNYVQTFQRRFRAAYKTLELPTFSGPTMARIFPTTDHMLVCWRALPEDIQITTDPRVDLDNIAKVVMDSMQSEGGRPGLLYNDKLVHILTLDRIRSPQP